MRVFSEDADYAKHAYGVTDKELEVFVKRADAELKRDRRAGRVSKYKGDLRAAVRKNMSAGKDPSQGSG